MKLIILSLLMSLALTCFGAYQYNVKGNQSWITFDSETTLSFNIDRSGKDKEHENFIDRGEGILDYGWYNINTGETGSFNNGLTATFKSTDKIGLYVTDNKGNTYLSTKSQTAFENSIWGKSKLVDNSLIIGGGNLGSNGTHEYYVFKINTAVPNNQPTGQPLPGIIATLIIGSFSIWYLKNRKYLIKAN